MYPFSDFSIHADDHGVGVGLTMAHGGTSVEDIQAITLPPVAADFQGAPLAIGDLVVFAYGRGQLGYGRLVELTGKTATVKSLLAQARYATVEAMGCLKMASTHSSTSASDPQVGLLPR